eukprot:TRINITY_DN22989_c0_g1_i1.p1 TRINITY_DN22989_c0_g1~~TRINITY_DN22989_c0_g1_i1.p1  ORF type:complete len:251 (-),score=31.75 TRINITY_DN22989_c0_g1_i1:288-1040(-)
MSALGSLRGIHCSATLPATTTALSPPPKMKIAVLGGSGNVGSRLAQNLYKAGHDIVLASRNPSDPKVLKSIELIKSEGGSSTVTGADLVSAAAGADALIIATPGLPILEAWQELLHPIESYPGVVLDATNPLTAYPALDISVDQNTTSATEDIQKVLVSASVFKAFNTLGAELMSKTSVGGKKLDMLYAGPAEGPAKETAEKIISDVGFMPVWVGPQRAARNLESIAELWIHMALKYGFGRNFAFGIVKE